ncbi:MAG: sensor N-terminal transmembrane domain-containing protein, partial [Sphingobium sp.]
MALRWSGQLSLTRRILAVNIFALALLAGGFFYLDSYRSRVVDERLQRSLSELQLLGTALESTPDAQHDGLINAFASKNDGRIRQYSADGRLETDSFKLAPPRYVL